MRPVRTALLALVTAWTAATSPTPAAAQQPPPAAAPITAPPAAPADPYLWLEQLDGERALAWVRERNAEAEKEFAADRRHEPLRSELLQVLDSAERIPFIERQGPHLYNFWRDARNPRGVWRRTTLEEYRRARPNWEELLDLDALASREGENWVWKGATCLRPDKPGEPTRRCIVRVSRGGADAVVLREFDLDAKRLPIGEEAFVLGEGRQHVAWKDADTVWIASDFAPGERTRGGYARVVREWKRGQLASRSPVVFEVQESDLGAWGWSERDSGVRRDWFLRSISTWSTEVWVETGGRRVRLEVPADAMVSTFRDQLLVRLRSAWTVGGRTLAAGGLYAIGFDAFLRGERSFAAVLEPGERGSIVGFSATRNALVITVLDNIRPRVIEARPEGDGWRREVAFAPDAGRIGRLSGEGGNVTGFVHTDWASDEYFFRWEDPATPSTLFRRVAGEARAETLKTLPAFFDARGLVTRQYEAVSRDGTRVPYFVVMRADAPLDGRTPTILYGYGGFGHSELPWYSGIFGRGWFGRGGALAIANLRGGGEFGPAWHEAARRQHKQRTWDDYAAVAEDLARRGIAAPARIGSLGGSQGGLLTATAMVQRPELFGAVVSQVPLIDMLRYHLLPIGASWIGEYGDPTKPEEAAWIAPWSPYQNVRAGVKYPPAFFTTSTRDDRVHPGHARKMVARMIEQGHRVTYFENIEGGHAGAANNAQAARMWAQTFSFLWRTIGAP